MNGKLEATFLIAAIVAALYAAYRWADRKPILPWRIPYPAELSRRGWYAVAAVAMVGLGILGTVLEGRGLDRSPSGEPLPVPDGAGNRLRVGDTVELVNTHGMPTVAAIGKEGFVHMTNPTRVRLSGVFESEAMPGVAMYWIMVLEGPHAGEKMVASPTAMRFRERR